MVKKTSLEFQDDSEGPQMKDLYPYTPEIDEVEQTHAREKHMRTLFEERGDKVKELIGKVVEQGEIE